MFVNVMHAVRLMDTLKYIYLQTGTKYYGMHLGPSKGYITPSYENNPRLKEPNFYYDLESYLTKEVGNSWTYNISRPPCIIGFTVKTSMNFGVSLAVYACVMKELGKRLIFPYSETCYHAQREFVDAKLLVRFILWMTPDNPREGEHKVPISNEIFNITNGDTCRMEILWPKIAQYFGMETELSPQPFNVAKFMKDKGHIWDKVVEKHNLKKYSITDLATFDFMHFILSREWDDCTSIQKAIECGFNDSEDTEKTFFNFFDGLKNLNIIPKKISNCSITITINLKRKKESKI